MTSPAHRITSGHLPETELAQRIWWGGVNSVRAERLIAEHVRLDDDGLRLAEHRFRWADFRRLAVVGGGKAAGYMAAALETILLPVAEQKGLHGWINVPQSSLLPTRYLHLHAARPAAINEPRPEGVEGSRQIEQLVRQLDPRDLCICILTGGGSALLPAPVSEVSLDDKLLLTRFLSGGGASIQELNQVRRVLSTLKGGGLARQCRAETLITLIISDILGDPLDLIASGPTFFLPESENAGEAAARARAILVRYDPDQRSIPASIWRQIVRLEAEEHRQADAAAERRGPSQRYYCVLANNQTAVDGAAREAERAGLRVHRIPPEASQTTAEEAGRHLWEQIRSVRAGAASSVGDCILWGGEPIVRLVPSELRGVGGRNQQLVLASFLSQRGIDSSVATSDGRKKWPKGVSLLSGGTDGEDGPTDAAGAVIDGDVAQRIEQLADPNCAEESLRTNDAYRFWNRVGGLLRTGPTHTNVCDLRVAVILK